MIYAKQKRILMYFTSFLIGFTCMLWGYGVFNPFPTSSISSAESLKDILEAVPSLGQYAVKERITHENRTLIIEKIEERWKPTDIQAALLQNIQALNEATVVEVTLENNSATPVFYSELDFQVTFDEDHSFFGVSQIPGELPIERLTYGILQPQEKISGALVWDNTFLTDSITIQYFPITETIQAYPFIKEENITPFWKDKKASVIKSIK